MGCIYCFIDTAGNHQFGCPLYYSYNNPKGENNEIIDSEGKRTDNSKVSIRDEPHK